MTETPYAQIALAAAAAGAVVLPSPEPLAVGTVAVGDPQVAGPFAGAVVADLEGVVPGRIAVLVGAELVEALASSPLGGLDVAAALQPTLDAVATALHARVGAARETASGLVVRELSSPFTVAFLHTNSVAAAVLIPDNVLAGAQNAQLSGAVSTDEMPALAPSAEPASVEQAVLSGAVLSSVGPLAGAQRHQPGIEMLHGVDMEVTVEIGRTRMTVRDLLDLTPGAVLELDRAAGSPADLLVNGRLIARGEVVVIDEDFGLRITEIAVDAAASWTPMLELTLRLIFSLAVVLGLLALLAKLGARRFRGGKDAMVQVLHRQHLSRGAAVSVVTVGSRVLVLGTTEQQVRVLAELDPEEIADELTPGEVLTLVPGETDATFALPPAEARPAGAHRAAPKPARPANAKGGRRVARPAAATSSLSGSVLSTDTWRQAFAAASRKAS